MLEHCRKPLLTFGHHCRRIRRHLPRMAQALPRERKQRVAANPWAAVPRLSRNRSTDIEWDKVRTDWLSIRESEPHTGEKVEALMAAAEV
jgi:hypothetical protein